MRNTLLLAVAVFLAVGADAQMKRDASTPAAKAPSATATPGAKEMKAIPVQRQTLDAVRRISVKDAHKLVNEGKAVIVDVRSKEQYDLGHIKGALSIPGSQLMSRLREVPPGKMIITYCACTAEQSSGRAVIDLVAHNVKNAAALQGGWVAWKDAGLPTSR